MAYASSASQDHGRHAIGACGDASLKGRIVGFGNGPTPPPSDELSWDDFENVMGSLYESTLTGFDQVFEAFGLSDDTMPSNLKMQETVNEPEDDFGKETTGPYRIVAKEVIVSSSRSLGGTCVARLGTGDCVQVDKLARFGTRIRALISEPAGWISLFDVESLRRWAERVDDTRSAKADAYSAQAPAATSTSSATKKEPVMDDLIDMAVAGEDKQTDSTEKSAAQLPSLLLPPPPKAASTLQASASAPVKTSLVFAEPQDSSWACFDSVGQDSVADKTLPVPSSSPSSQRDSSNSTSSASVVHPVIILDPLSFPSSDKTMAVSAGGYPSTDGTSDSKQNFPRVSRGISSFDPLSETSLDFENALGM
eukprot:TRINITY_DN18008_c0_g1_i2.p1 TRINITY_DN18008_c0_g1~~TRINITY_DN18008_c0_g1_i2.p1  ORF type:complete len:366 (-),score=77.28 TRINITY_DN18008_c0_g1_i2:206-1303(-)